MNPVLIFNLDQQEIMCLTPYYFHSIMELIKSPLTEGLMELFQGKDKFKEGTALPFSDAFLILEQVKSQAKQQKAKLLTCLIYFQLHQKETCSLSLSQFIFLQGLANKYDSHIIVSL